MIEEQDSAPRGRSGGPDVTHREAVESERDITMLLLRQAGIAAGRHELLSGITALLQRWSGCEAVGIRLPDGDEYPYYETRGFSNEFVQAENRLCATDEQGCPVRDGAGKPVLECMCGNILRGRFDPNLPFFTETGSFFTNSTSELLATTTEAERQARTRNRCNGEGYESVALIPLRAGGEVLGLVQFNDRRKGMFSALRIGLFERLAYIIASAVARQKALEALRASEEKLRRQQWSLAEAQRITHIGSWDWNNVDNQLIWSDEVYRIFGLERRDFGGTYDAFLASVHPDDREVVKAAVNRSLADRSAEYDIQHRVLRPDGTVRWVHERGEVQFDGRGKPSRMIGTVHDITEQKAMESESRRLRAALAHSERVGTVGALTSAIAHEINQPLAAILSNAQASLRLLDAKPPDLDEVREALKDMVSDAKRTAEIIHRMRRMLKKEEPRRERLDLSAVMAEVIPLIRNECKLRSTTLEKDLAAGLPPVLGDPVQIQQVALNLLMNALDAMKDQPESARRVEISTRSQEDGWVSIHVRDTGPGIPTGTLEEIFDPFYTTKPHGIGLGLTICRFIAEAHGGRLRAGNRPGGGSEISLSLPAAGESGGGTSEPGGTSAAGPSRE